MRMEEGGCDVQGTRGDGGVAGASGAMELGAKDRDCASVLEGGGSGAGEQGDPGAGARNHLQPRQRGPHAMGAARPFPRTSIFRRSRNEVFSVGNVAKESRVEFPSTHFVIQRTV